MNISRRTSEGTPLIGLLHECFDLDNGIARLVEVSTIEQLWKNSNRMVVKSNCRMLYVDVEAQRGLIVGVN
jgi:hypothetical protein